MTIIHKRLTSWIPYPQSRKGIATLFNQINTSAIFFSEVNSKIKSLQRLHYWLKCGTSTIITSLKIFLLLYCFNSTYSRLNNTSQTISLNLMKIEIS